MRKNKVIQSVINSYQEERQRTEQEYKERLARSAHFINFGIMRDTHAFGYEYAYESVVVTKKKKCTFCNGSTEDDARGNCSACGAPRTE